ncbi:MAG: DUF975 family protein [Roseburia sp.]|nr:DUF975 family protein [Roseburia sp.]
MNLSCKELKRQARETLNGRYGLPMGTYVTAGLIVLAVTFPFNYSYQKNPDVLQSVIYSLATVIISLLSIVLSCGIIRIQLDMARGKEKTFADLFYYFGKRPDRLIFAQLLMILIFFVAMIPVTACAICSVLFYSKALLTLTVILTVATTVLICYLSLTFGLIYFFLVDNETIGVIAAYRLSLAHMRGNRGRLLYIRLSFIGMELLCLFSFGIGVLWIAPYINQTVVAFYRNTIGEVS